MRVTDLERLYDYGYWANAKLFDVLARLTPDEFTRCVAGGHASVRNTLVHILSAEWGWLDRVGGWPRPERLKPESYPTPASLIEQWGKVEGKMNEFLASITAEQLDEIVEFSIGRDSFRQERGQLLRHSTTHSVHHRGQVSLMIRELGKTPGNFDLLFYSEEAGRSA